MSDTEKPEAQETPAQIIPFNAEERAKDQRRELVVQCEQSFVSPMGEQIAKLCGVTLISDELYTQIHPSERTLQDFETPEKEQFSLQDITNKEKLKQRTEAVKGFEGRKPLNMLYVVLNRDRVVHRSEFSEWDGVCVTVSDLVVAAIHIECHTNGKHMIPYVKIWEKERGKNGGYIFCGDASRKQMLPSHQAVGIVASFLKQQKIL